MLNKPLFLFAKDENDELTNMPTYFLLTIELHVKNEGIFIKLNEQFDEIK